MPEDIQHPRIGRRALKRGVPTLIGVIQETVPITVLRDAMLCGMHVAELRIDLFPERMSTDALVEYVGEVSLGVPTLLTIRREDEGGEFRGTKAERLALYEALIPHVHAVDVELKSDIAPLVLASAQKHDALTILSLHNFRRVPTGDALDSAVLQFGNLIRAGRHDRSSVVLKIAAHIPSWDEYMRFARFVMSQAKEDDWNVIAVGMGEKYGPMSRICFSSLGSLATYAALSRAIVSGQLNVPQTGEVLRVLYPPA